MRKFINAIVVLFGLVPMLALAGGSSPGLYYGQVPTPSQWNSYFAAKLDYTPGAANSVPYWDGAGNQLNAVISGDCSATANVFTCAHSTNLSGGTLGAIPYQSGVGTTSFLSGNTTTTPKFVTSTGSGSAALAPTLTSSTGSGSVVLATAPTITGDLTVTGRVIGNLIPTSTFASLPAASTVTGQQYRVTDIGLGNSVWYSNGTQWHPVGGQVKLSADAIPIGIPPGNGSTVGLQFTNATGAFALATTIFPNAYVNGIWLWMPIGAFDGTNPVSAAFYWAVMSTTSAGQLYTATYQAGIPTGLVQATTTASRWLTQTTAEVTLRSTTVPGNAMGPNGILKIECLYSLNNGSTKTERTRFGGTLLTSLVPAATSLGNQYQSVIRNNGLTNSNVGAGSGSVVGSTATNNYSAIDTTTNQTLTQTAQLTVNTDYAILEGSSVILTPGF